MPHSIAVTGQHQVTEVMNRAEALGRIRPELQSLVAAAVRDQVNRVFKEQLPDAGVRTG